ncbi:MAG: alanine--glyoxylate aminotransferase family protein [Armatimonadetes bacterium]|nr:alanine--glyoxylate aminotransferase family protein [Armatimonadota bacterium]MDW8120897.1 alanine--glyoxylate aminotransferase family protein [Armatimonadota bacterium]
MTQEEDIKWQDLAPPERILMGPGPSNVDPRVLRALIHQPIGHLDPEFLTVMDEVRSALRRLFRTQNELTFPVSGTGSGGMESCLANLIEPGDKVLVFVIGFFGDRIAQMAKRLGADLVVYEKPWGQAVNSEEVRSQIQKHMPKIIALVHGETSTGVLQPLEGIGALAREYDSLLLVDTVATLGGVPFGADELLVDATFSATQKCLSAPPGLAPVTYGERAIAKLKARRQPPVSWYFDALLLRSYWGEDRAYHHTAPINMVFALREALRLIEEEGLENRWARHRVNSEALSAGLQALGLQFLVTEPEHRLPVLTSIIPPASVDEGKVRKRLLTEFHLEIGAGLGPYKGRLWRFGLMGHSSQKRNVLLALSALATVLRSEGFACSADDALSAAESVYQKSYQVRVEV